MNDYILMHSGAVHFSAKRKSNIKNYKYKTYTEVSSIGLTGDTKVIKYYKEDELFHCFDGVEEFVVDREAAIDRKVKSDYRKGLWGDNERFSRIKDDSYLMHHGVKNQRWGKRNGPPYLSHSAKGQSWDKHKYIRIENGRYIYPEDLKKMDATSFYGNQSTNLSKALNNKTGGTFTALKFKTTKHKDTRQYDLATAMAKINDKYKGTMNCTACTAALDYLLRNKNRNIKIDVPDFNGATKEQITDLYRTKDGKKPVPVDMGLVKNGYYNQDPNFWRTYNPRKNANDAIENMRKQGDGARGHLVVDFMEEFKDGTLAPLGSHDILYIVKNNKVFIIDGQSSEIVEAEKYLNKAVGYDELTGMPVYRHVNYYLRTDDLNVNYKNDFYKDKLQVGPERAKENNIVRQKVKKSAKETIKDFMKKMSFKKITKAVKNLGKSFIKALFGR